MLRQFFSAEVPEELAQAQFLAEKISSYGGTPTSVEDETSHYEETDKIVRGW